MQYIIIVVVVLTAILFFFLIGDVADVQNSEYESKPYVPEVKNEIPDYVVEPGKDKG